MHPSRRVQSAKPTSRAKLTTQKRPRPASATPAPPVPPSVRTLSQREASSRFVEICKELVENGGKLYVQDKSATKYLTISSSRANVKEPVIDVSAQRFKDKFSSFSGLVKIGMCFRIKLRNSNRHAYARPFGSFVHPLADVIAEHQSKISISRALEGLEATLLTTIGKQDEAHASHREEVLDHLEKLKHGVARLAIGHRPFEEGTVR
jgi:hypothetical protein